jgi:hypothetical protein
MFDSLGRICAVFAFAQLDSPTGAGDAGQLAGAVNF